MPGRTTLLVTGEIYHAFNRGIDRRPTFTTKREYQRAIASIKFYKFNTPPIRLSKFLLIESQRQLDILKIMETKGDLVEIICYCLMPNHFHFLLKQLVDDGIAKFLSNFQNSYTRYFNTRHKRDGSLFLDQFKAIRIETDEQLIHVSRYIHLNPHTGFIVKSLKELENYPYSSYPDYIKKQKSFINTNLILNLFKDHPQYINFVSNQADYQRRLKEIEHLIME